MQRFYRWVSTPTSLKLAVVTGLTVLLYSAKVNLTGWRSDVYEIVEILLAALTNVWIWGMYSKAEVDAKVQKELEQFKAAAAFDAMQQVRRDYRERFGFDPKKTEWKA